MAHPTQLRFARRRLLLFGAGLAAAFGALLVVDGRTLIAVAEWLSSGAGNGRSIAQSIPQGAPPTGMATGRNVTVTWDETQLSGGTTAGGYVIRRFVDGGGAATVLAGCDGIVTALTCTEVDVPSGVWRYSMQPVLDGWSGAESHRSAALTVGTSSLAFTSSTIIPAASLPTVLSGTLTAFLANEDLTFHLDGPTGPALDATPSSVAADGSATVSVTVPAGTDDAPHSVFAVGSLGSLASASITILDPPTTTSVEMRDVNANGKIDRVVAVFQKPLAPYSAGIAPWTLTSVPSGGSLTAVTVSGNVATLTLAEGVGPPDTSVGSFTVALEENSGGIRDDNGQLASFSATAPVDRAAPALTGAPTMNDADANGRIDQITMEFSETLASSNVSVAPWSLANVPSGGTLSAVSLPTTNTVTLAIAEESGPLDTSVGNFTVGLVADASGLRDASDNRTALAGVVPADGARPVRVTSAAFDNDANGKFDRVAVTFSEALGPYTAGSTPWSFTSPPLGTTLNNVTVSGAVATLALNESTAPATAIGSWTVTLNANAAGIKDAALNLSSYTAVAPTDQAIPTLTGPPQLLDVSANGKVDQVTIVMSEPLLAYTAGSAPWTLTNVPSGASLQSVAVVNGTTTSTVTLALNEGTGAPDTAVGSMTVALAADGVGGIRDAGGNVGSFGPTAPLDKAKPARVSGNAYDDNANGKFDRVAFTFSETLSAYSAGNTPWSFSSAPTGMTLNNVTLTGAVATLTLNEGTATTTALGSWKIALTANAAGVRDAAANLASYVAVAPTDMAAPVPTGPPQLVDAVLVNGKVDRFTILMSETLGAYSAGTAPWTLTGVPSGGTILTPSVSSSTVTVTLTEGAGAPDTAVGSMTVAMAANPLGVRDIVGNLSSVATVTPLDKAKPARLSANAYDDNANGKFDRVAVTFSEPLAGYTGGTTPWAFTTPPPGTTLNNVTTTGAIATLALNEGTAATTAVGSWKIALTANAAGVRDAAANLTSYSAVAPSDKAAPVPTGAPQLLDFVVNGKVDRFTILMSEALTTYTAGTAPWTLTGVPSGGTILTPTVSSSTVTVTLTEGAGAPDTTVGSMTIAMAPNPLGLRDATGNLSSIAPTTPLDKAKPARLSANAYDDNTNGKFDRVAVTFSETLSAYTAGTTPWAFTTSPAGTTLNNVSTTGAVATLALNEGTATTTAISTWTIALTANAAGIRDAAANQTSYTAVAPTDKAAPALTTLTMLDAAGGDGIVDKVTAVFSETVIATTLTSPWTLANVPSQGTLTTVSSSSATVTLNLNGATVDTRVGGFTTALAANAAGVKDATNNLSSFSATAPIDGAGPAAASITDTNGPIDGRIEANDTLSITLSEPLGPTVTLPSSVTVTLEDPVGGSADNLVIPGILTGLRTTGSDSYILADGTSAVFNTSTVALSADRRTITITVGPTCSGTACSTGTGTQLSAVGLSFLGDPGLTDAAGVIPTTIAKLFLLRLF